MGPCRWVAARYNRIKVRDDVRLLLPIRSQGVLDPLLRKLETTKQDVDGPRKEVPQRYPVTYSIFSMPTASRLRRRGRSGSTVCFDA